MSYLNEYMQHIYHNFSVLFIEEREREKHLLCLLEIKFLLFFFLIFAKLPIGLIS